MKWCYLIFFTILTSCYVNERDCSSFKTGNFVSEIEINSRLYESTFERQNNIQIETFEGKIDSFSVRWINDCEMIFSSLNPKKQKDKKIHIKILNTTNDSYQYEYGYVGESKKKKGKAKRIN